MAVDGQNYTNIEIALLAEFLSKFSDRLTEDTCKIADLDSVFNSLMGYPIDEYTDGLVLDFAGGTSRPRQAYGNIKWAWITSGVYLIRYHDDIEDALRIVATRIPTVLQENPRLGGASDLSYITEIGDPAIGKINDVSFYLVAFFIESLDRSVRL